MSDETETTPITGNGHRTLPAIPPDATEDEPEETPTPAPIMKPTVNDPLEADGGNRNNPTQAGQFADMARWHLAMRLFHDVATSMNLDKNDGERMRLFERRHPRLFRICLGIDLFFTTCCMLLAVGTMGLAFVRITGITVPWW